MIYPPEHVDSSVPGMLIRGVKLESGDSFHIYMETVRDGWNAYHEDHIRRLEAGNVIPTTLWYREVAYCIYAIEARGEGVCYITRGWPQTERMIQNIELSAEAAMQNEQECKAWEKMHLRAQTAWIYEVFLGWLPLDIMESLEDRLQLNTVAATIKSCMLQGAISILLIFSAMLTGDVSLRLVAAYLLLDAMIRSMAAYMEERGYGLLILEIPWRIFVWLRDMKGESKS